MEKKLLLKELKEKIENAESWDYDEYYTTMLNATIDYQNETQEWDFEYLFEDIIDYELAEDYARRELEEGGLVRLYYFMGNANMNNEIFRVNGYDNLEDIDKDDLDCIKNEILEIIEEKETQPNEPDAHDEWLDHEMEVL